MSNSVIRLLEQELKKAQNVVNDTAAAHKETIDRGNAAQRDVTRAAEYAAEVAKSIADLKAADESRKVEEG